MPRACYLKKSEDSLQGAELKSELVLEVKGSSLCLSSSE